MAVTRDVCCCGHLFGDFFLHLIDVNHNNAGIDNNLYDHRYIHSGDRHLINDTTIYVCVYYSSTNVAFDCFFHIFLQLANCPFPGLRSKDVK